MSDSRLTIRIGSRLRAGLRKRAKLERKSESDIVRSLLERELASQRPRAHKKRSFYDALLESGLIGSAPDAPADLSTNKEYMKGFGEWDSDAYREKAARSKRKA